MARTLITAIENGEESLAKDIIQDGRYGVHDKQTVSIMVDKALFICCSRGFLELAQLLLNKGANVATTDRNLSTPLHGAADNGHVDLVRLLIDHGADVNAQNCRGDSPLHLATYRGHVEITRCLMEAGADCRLVNTKLLTAENEAVLQGHTDVVTYLRSEKIVRSSLTGERNDGFPDSMILLDAPSISSIQDLHTNPPAIEKQGTTHLHPISKQQQNRSGCPVESCDLEFSPISDFITIHANQLRNLSWIVLDPPEDYYPTSECMSSCHTTFCAKCGDGSSKLPRYCSTCSCASDLTVGVHKESTCCSGTSHLTVGVNKEFTGLNNNNNRSRAPDELCMCRSKDIDLQEESLVNRYVDTQKEDAWLEALGVKNPPVKKQIPQLATSTQHKSVSAISDMYDSTLFSLRSIECNSLIPPQSKTATKSLDYPSTEKDEQCVSSYSKHNHGLRLTSDSAGNSPLAFVNKAVTNHELNDYTVLCPTNSFQDNCSGNRFYDFTRMTSDNLFSSFYLKEKSLASMTR